MLGDEIHCANTLARNGRKTETFIKGIGGQVTLQTPLDFDDNLIEEKLHRNSFNNYCLLNEIFFVWYNQGHKVSNKVPKGLFALTNAFLIAVASQIAVAQTTKK